jgi:hypothetical protein
MGGWVTWVGVVLISISAGVKALGYPEVADALEKLGLSIMGVGIGRKIEKKKA